MMNKQAYLALDMGVGSCQVIVGENCDHHLQISEIHRFNNKPVRFSDGYHWDILSLWQNIKDGLRLAAHRYKTNLVSLGLDAWRDDFALLDKSGGLLYNPYTYFDTRTQGMPQEAFQRVPLQVIYEQTGQRLNASNTLVQLLALVIRRSPALTDASKFLMLPDLFNYWFSGNTVCEYTAASTSRCLDIHKQTWANNLLEKMEIPTHIFPPVVQPGVTLGALLRPIMDETGAAPLTIIAPACHNTASTVAAVPTENSDVMWISIGTRSFMGVEVKAPITTSKALNADLDNEGGINKTYLLSKKTAGLGLIQECIRTWSNAGEAMSFNDLCGQAGQAVTLLAVLDPDASDFSNTGDIPALIRSYCQRTGQSVPETKGAIVRVIFEGIALKSRWVLEQLEMLLGRSLSTIHIVGRGAQIPLLSQLIADATNRIVISGPVEAKAIGNIIIQMTALGHIHSLHEGRELVRRSFSLKKIEPHHNGQWDTAYGRLLNLL